MLVLLQKVEETIDVVFLAQMKEHNQEFANVFQPTLAGLPLVREVRHMIPLKLGAKPLFMIMYRMSPLKNEEAK